jgi:hypothetical protein
MHQHYHVTLKVIINDDSKFLKIYSTHTSKLDENMYMLVFQSSIRVQQVQLNCELNVCTTIHVE